MSRRLIFLNILLLAAAGFLGWRLRRQWAWENQRELALFGYRQHATPVRALVPLPKPAPFEAALYAEVAQNNLFSKDRNAEVLVDAPPPPPPPPPVPPFPVARGVMLWEGVPPTIVLSERAGGPQKGYHPGDKIGPWQLTALDSRYVTFSWNDKEFKKRIDELLDSAPIETIAAPPASTAAAAAAPAKPQETNLSNSNNQVGSDTGGGNRGCVAGDSSPAGTVVDGYKKNVVDTPFGHQCFWQAVK